MSEWISVEDDLPKLINDAVSNDVSADVLVWATNLSGDAFSEGEKYFAIDRLCKWNDVPWLSFRTDRFYGKVTHWMPLPVPPEEKE